MILVASHTDCSHSRAMHNSLNSKQLPSDHFIQIPTLIWLKTFQSPTSHLWSHVIKFLTTNTDLLKVNLYYTLEPYSVQTMMPSVVLWLGSVLEHSAVSFHAIKCKNQTHLQFKIAFTQIKMPLPSPILTQKIKEYSSRHEANYFPFHWWFLNDTVSCAVVLIRDKESCLVCQAGWRSKNHQIIYGLFKSTISSYNYIMNTYIDRSSCHNLLPWHVTMGSHPDDGGSWFLQNIHTFLHFLESSTLL